MCRILLYIVIRRYFKSAFWCISTAYVIEDATLIMDTSEAQLKKAEKRTRQEREA